MTVSYCSPDTPSHVQVFFQICTFYRAMHFSANARSWDRMSSVRLSVTLVICDHIGWKSWKLIAREQLAQHLRSLSPKGDPPTPRGT